MGTPCISSEARQTGRFIYIFGMFAVAINAFNIKLTASDNIPLSFPPNFPVAGALALVNSGLAVSMAVRVIDAVVDYADAEVLTRVTSPINPSISPFNVASNRVATERNTWFSWRLLALPAISGWFKWAAFVIDGVIPILFSIFVVLFCANSIKSLFNDETLYHYSARCLNIKDALLVENLERGSNMTMAQSLAIATGDSKETMVRHINPDGQVGGMVSSDSTVPRSVFVPINSVVCPGVVLSEGTVVPERVIIEKSGTTIPNRPVLIGKVKRVELHN